jgi:Mn-dependent DtxR family transcriptional regulator
MGKASAQRVAKVLLRICTHPEVSNQTYLAKMLGISSSGMSKHMEGLQRRGLVERRGYREYALTPKAAGYLQRAVEAEA